MFSMRRLLFAATILSAGLVSAVGNAATYTATLSGNVVFTHPDLATTFAVGQAATFVVTYDDNIPNHSGIPNFGEYISPGIGWTIQVGPYNATASGGALRVLNDLAAGALSVDLFRGALSADPSAWYFGNLSAPALGLYQLSEASFQLDDYDGLALNSGALLTSAPSLTEFEAAYYLSLIFDNGVSPVSVSALISDFSIAQTPAVPIPAALPLFATVLAGGGLIAWRRKRKAAQHIAG